MKRTLLRFVLLVLVCLPMHALAQVVTGKVSSSADGAPIPGASVLLKGTGSGTSTDGNGAFSINVTNPEGAVLVISFIGFQTQEVPVGVRQTIDVVLAEDIAQLNEVVVTALGVEREAKTLVYGC